MITGGAYIAATIVLALLMRYGSREPHQILESEDIFRYPKAMRYIIMMGVPLWIIAAIAARLTARPDIDTPMLLNIATAVGIFVSIANAVIAAYYNRFYLSVTSSGIRWGGFKIRSLLFSEISRIEVFTRDKGRKWLTFYGPDDRNLLRVTSDLQEFEDLVDLVREYGGQAGVGFEMKTLPFF